MITTDSKDLCDIKPSGLLTSECNSRKAKKFKVLHFIHRFVQAVIPNMLDLHEH